MTCQLVIGREFFPLYTFKIIDGKLNKGTTEKYLVCFSYVIKLDGLLKKLEFQVNLAAAAS